MSLLVVESDEESHGIVSCVCYGVENEIDLQSIATVLCSIKRSSNNSTPRNAYTYSPKDINWCGHNNTIHNDFNLETTQMSVKGGMKLVVIVAQ